MVGSAAGDATRPGSRTPEAPDRAPARLVRRLQLLDLTTSLSPACLQCIVLAHEQAGRDQGWLSSCALGINSGYIQSGTACPSVQSPWRIRRRRGKSPPHRPPSARLDRLSCRGERHVERVFHWADSHAFQAAEAFGRADLDELIDREPRGRPCALAAIDARFTLRRMRSGLRQRRQAHQRAVGTKIAAPEILHEHRGQQRRPARWPPWCP